MVRNKKMLKNQRPIIEVCQADSVQNAASTLLANIRFSGVDAPLKAVAFTSSVPNEGKTTVALSLAIAAGRNGDKVLIMECDMRRRSLRAIIGARPRFGVHAVLTGKCSLEEAVVVTEFEGVSFLDSEAGIPNPDGILSSHTFSNLLDGLRDEYDYVIIDTPPITAFPDASIVSSRTDATILVARENYTDKREISYALQQLRAADANVLGVALNCQDASAGGAYYGYYYGYYYDEKKVAADSPEAKEALERAESGDSSISVTPVSGKEAAGSDDHEAADAQASKRIPKQGPTAAAPGSKKRQRKPQG